ncbi:MAG TPA: phosphoglucosamine mutase [Planctomycetaceae bacterium]|nr:phosphoglucosamine mutase [Planctomycetaceae bacterium]
MSELIISVSGLRGVIGETLTPEVAARYAIAFSRTMPDGPFVITRDSRPSGGMLADAIHAALNATGRNTVDAEIASTPTAGILIRTFGAAGGIQISASHNPIEFNGMKLFDSGGRVIPKGHGSTVLENYKNRREIAWVGATEIGERTPFRNTTEEHLKAILRTVDADAIAARRFRVLLDANHGAGAILGARLLEALNCDVTILGEEPDGHFAHTPEPTPENLTTVCASAKQLGVDVTFCQDPDADRLAVIDDQGRYIGEEYTVALCLEHLLKTADNPKRPFARRKGSVVINCATSRMCEDIAAKYGVKIFRSAVGEANVVDLMLEKNAMFGGEGNGGPIDPKIGPVRDSFVGIAMLLEAMALREQSIAELAAGLPEYSIVKRKMSLPCDRIPKALEALNERLEGERVAVDFQDGLRIDFADSWVLLRASNTEPIVRTIAEAPTPDRANALCDAVETICTEICMKTG